MDSFENRVKAGLDERAAMRAQILDYLAQDRAPCGTFEISMKINQSALDVQRAILDLVVDGKLVSVGTGWDDRPLYRPVETGNCEWCGLVDHHLVAGECPSCIERRAIVARQLS